MIKAKKFTPSELIEPSILKVVTEEAAMKLIGQVVIDNLDHLRIDYEEMVHALGRYTQPSDVWFMINGNYGGELFQYSGVRSKDCPIGVEYSTHKDGTTFDIKCAHLDILLALVKTYSELYQIKRIENPNITILRGWIHIEFSENPVGTLLIFDP